jgi:hypothetical protein
MQQTAKMAKMSYFTFYPKFQKPIKAVIHHLPQSSPEEDIYMKD